MRNTLTSVSSRAVLAAVLWLVASCSTPAPGTADGQGSWELADPPSAEYVFNVGIGIDGDEASLAATGSISLSNTSRRPLSVLALEWTLRPAGEFSVSAGGRPLEVLNAAKAMPPTTPLLLALPAPIPPGGRVKVDVRFTARAAVNDGQVHFGLWYPRLWREGRPVRDTFRVRLGAPPGFTAAVSGRLDPASGAYVNDCVTTHFGIFLSKSMKVERRLADGVEISALFTEKGRDCALFCLNAAAEIVPFYKKWLGSYPHRSLVILPGGDRPMGGYPYASGLVVVHGQETFDPAKGEKGNAWWTWITAHEIGHQYWGESAMSGDVAGDYTEAWLMIGLGICADKEYMLRTRPRLGPAPRLHRRLPRGRPGRPRYDSRRAPVARQGPEIRPQQHPHPRQGLRRAQRPGDGPRPRRRSTGSIAGPSGSSPAGGSAGGSSSAWPRPSRGKAWIGSSRIGSGPPRSSNAASCPRLRRRPKAGSFPKSGWSTARIPSACPCPSGPCSRTGPSSNATTDRLVRTNVLRFSARSPLREVVLDPDRRLGLVEEILPRSVRGDRRGRRGPGLDRDRGGRARILQGSGDRGRPHAPRLVQARPAPLRRRDVSGVPGGLPEVPRACRPRRATCSAPWSGSVSSTTCWGTGPRRSLPTPKR